MPIEVSTTIKIFNQEEFHALDRQVMGVVFEVHNEFGRLLDEKLYKCEIANRCLNLGLQPAEREVQIRVSHENFVKDYFMDLLVCHGFMLEGKVTEKLVAAHRGQALNYLLLTDMKHGRLINLRTERVQHEFISTTLTSKERRKYRVAEDGWRDLNSEGRLLRAKTLELLEDWGAFLDVNLYREALVYFLGGPNVVNKVVEVFSGSQRIGAQNMNLLNEETGFALSMLPVGAGALKEHLERLLRHTRLRAIQWINLNRHVVELTTLVRSSL